MPNAKLARRCAYTFMEGKSADDGEVADAARYRWLAATRFPLNAKPKAQLDAEIDFEMRRVEVPISAARPWVKGL
jgi:hypothetical protein